MTNCQIFGKEKNWQKCVETLDSQEQFLRVKLDGFGATSLCREYSHILETLMEGT